MYWRGKVDGPDGEDFSFYVNWVSTEHEFTSIDDGYLIVITPASGPKNVWISAEDMKTLVRHDPSVLKIPLLRARADGRRAKAFNSPSS